ncbi:MAG: sensor histidine kinase [Vicinamibacterales bacterium]|nr:sensor histidine kinase [Vicinamibacterales bacterium]
MQAPWGHIRLRVIWGVATLLGFFSGFQAYYFVSTFTERPSSFPLLLALNLNYWYGWAVLVPAVLWLSRRFPIERAEWVRSIAAHAGGVVVCIFLHAVMVVTGRMVILGAFGPDMRYAGAEGGPAWLQEFQRMFFLNFDWEMMTYWCIVGLSHALRFHYESQARALRESQLETRLVEARLHSLQHQLQPHFLFNTLNTISALMHRDVDAADRMIARLGELLRASLETAGVQEVSLKQELEFLERYLEIEQTRFRDRLIVQFDVHPGVLDALVPNLILQPLVENAIKHGLGPCPSGGTVSISAQPDAGQLVLEVRDDGVGLSAATLSDFNQGVGLANTRSRLQHLYGSDHRFEFRQPAAGGLSVVIVIPLDEVAGELLDEDGMEGVA